MTNYNFPLGNDHDDRDFDRVQHDLLAAPQRFIRNRRRAAHRRRQLLSLGREHG